MEKLYLDADNQTKASQIVDAIYKATNGTFKGSMCISTLIGIPKRFDEQGRDVTIDHNTHTSVINIDGIEYGLVTHGYRCTIVKPKWKDRIHHLSCPEQCCIAKINFEPDYVREYWYKRKH